MPPLCSETFDASARVTFNRRRPSRNRCDVMGLFAAPVNHSKDKDTRRVTTVMLLNAVAELRRYFYKIKKGEKNLMVRLDASGVQSGGRKHF